MTGPASIPHVGMCMILALSSIQNVYPLLHPTTTTSTFLAKSSPICFLNSRLLKKKKNSNSFCVSSSSSSILLAQKKDEDESIDEEGRSLAADFFQMLQSRNISLNPNELEEEDDEEEDDTVVAQDDDDDEDEEAVEEDLNIPQSAINVLRGIDSDGAGTLAGDPSITDRQVYDELKERVLESAGSFLDLVGTSGGSDEEEEEDTDEDEGLSSASSQPKEYVSPEIVPDSGLTAGEVVMTVLNALQHNDIPYPNRGVEVLLGYSAPSSAVTQAMYQGMTPEEYGEFLKEEDSEYKVLFDHEEDVVIDKGNYSVDKTKAFFTARVRTGPHPLDFTSVNFILTVEGEGEDDCWLIDSMLIRPEGMRRRRRR